MSKLFRKISIWRAFSPEKRVYLYRSIAFRANQGFSIHESLSKYADTYTGEKMKIGRYLSEIADKINGGDSHVDAFKEFVPNSELLILSAAEHDLSRLPGCFNDAAFLCESQNKLNKAFKKVLKSTIFKLLMVMAFFLVMAFMISDILVSLRLENLPWYTEAFLSFSTNIKSYWWVYLLFIVALIISVKLMMPRYVGRARPFLSKYIFPFNVYRLMTSSSFLIGFSSLVNGRSHTEALDSIASTSDPYLQSYAYEMYGYSRSGLDSDEVFNVDLFDPFLKVNLIDIMGSSDNSAGIRDLAVREMDLSADKFERINNFMSGMVLLVMAVAIFWSYASLAVPILDLLANQF